MPNNAKAIVVHVKSQSAVGTAATITPGTDEALRVVGMPTLSVRGEGVIERSDITSAVGPGLQPIKGSRGWEIQIVTELYRFSDIGDDTSSPLAPLWAACGIVTENANSSTNLTWEPTRNYTIGATVGTNIVPFTIQIDQIGGNRYVASDCQCTPEISFDAGGRVMITWTIHGLWDQPVASTLGVTTADYGADPLPFVAVGATLGTDLADYTAISTFSLATGLALVERTSVSATDGFVPSFLDFAEPPVIGFTGDSDDESALPIWTEAFAGTASDLDITLTDSGGETFKIQLPVAYPRVPGIGGDAFATYDFEFFGVPNGSGKSLIVTFDTN